MMSLAGELRDSDRISLRGLAPIGGVLVSVLVFPKLAPVWILQPLSGITGVINIGVFHGFQALYGGSSKEWLAGAAFAGGYIRSALDELETEREFTDTEREAFREFADRVESTAVWTDAGANADAAVLTKVKGNGDQLRQIRECYRETVMAVPDHDELYGESFQENFAAEFGEDLAAVVSGGAGFTQQMRELLVRQALESATRRSEHLESLDSERTSVRKANARLLRFDAVIEKTAPRKLIHCSFEELLEYDREIRFATDDCRDVLEDRQHDVHESNQRLRNRSDRVSLQEYLYRSIDPTFPVLATAFERFRELRDRRRAVIDSLTRRY